MNVEGSDLYSAPGVADNLERLLQDWTCRLCGAPGLQTVLSLGDTPLANLLVTRDQLARSEPRYPLDVVFCPACALVQLTHSIPPERMFAEYPYFSSYADAVVGNARALVDRLVPQRSLGAGNLAMEVGSNDGYLLANYVAAGVPVLGIEPARNVAAAAISRGVPTRCDFFTRELAAELRSDGRRADVLHANNVLAHVPDVNGFVAGLAAVLSDEGIAVIETPYIRDLIERVEFDTIYHEHLFYYSLSSLDILFRRNGLVIVDVERIPIHGGTLRVFAARAGASEDSAVSMLMADERALGMTSFNYYRDFAARVDDLCKQLRAMLLDLKESGRRIAAYGAAAKGVTLLNRIGVGAETLDFVVDRNVHKQGRFMPGVHVPIDRPERLLDEMPDYVLLLAWNFRDEVMAQQAEYRARGGRFIVPVPEARIC